MFGQTYYGNQYTKSTGLYFGFNQTNQQVAERFTMLNPTNQVTTLYFTTQVVGTSAQYLVGLQTDNAGIPSGTWVTGPVTTTLTGLWTTVPVTPATLNQNQVYHIVIQYYSGTMDAMDYTQWSFDSTLNGLIPLNQTIDPQLNYLTYSGGSWTVGGGTPIFGLGFSDSSFYGNPYDSGGELQIFGNDQGGQNFIPSTPVTFDTVGAFIYKIGTPVDDVRYYIVDTTQGITLTSGTLAQQANVSTSRQWVDTLGNEEILWPVTTIG